MGFVLLDDQGTGKQFVFQNPETVITADCPKDLEAAFTAIEAAQDAGKWLAGWMSYDLGRALEPRFTPPEGPLIRLGVFGAPGNYPPADWLYTRDVPALDFKPSWTEADYLRRFTAVQNYLQAGDCYQVNLTFPMFAKSAATPTQIYAAFRQRQPGRYGAVVSLGGADIVSFSPELFFQRTGKNMRMRPMKGTRPRAENSVLDAALLAEMRAEPKSQAENLMIVDLLRNDLSRLCELGSVKVPELFTLETYPTLHQMTSEVTGSLKPSVTWADIFQSLFPCGSVTGAPKIRAMEIINELESGSRQAYCGGVGYIAPNGDASFSVAIRTVQMQDGEVRYDVGSGVVLDSDGSDEYAECLLKSQIFNTPKAGVIETFRRLPKGEIPREDLHFARLSKQVDVSSVKTLKDLLERPSGQDERVRLIVRDGEFSQRITLFEEMKTPLSLCLSRYELEAQLQGTTFKTTMRDFYDGERARLQALMGVDEVIFFNADGDLCEGSFTTLFIEKQNKLLTPDVSCGLLPGVLRQDLLNSGDVSEAILTLADIKSADAIYVGNSLRGLMPAEFIDFLPH